MGVEYPKDHKFHYDGVSEFYCKSCETRVGAFCGTKLDTNEVEKVYCEGNKTHPIYVELWDEKPKKSPKTGWNVHSAYCLILLSVVE